jgi:hypothetical protein
MEAAIDLSSEGKDRKALAAFDKLVKQYPDVARVRFERAMVLMNLDRDEEAEQALHVALQLDPSFPGAANWLAKAQAGQGQHEAAARTALAALLSKPVDDWSANGQAWADCAENLLLANEPARAIEALVPYFERYEGRQKGYERYLGAPHRIKAKALLALGRGAEALVSATHAASLPGTVPADQFLVVRALASTGEHDRAKTMFMQLAEDYEGTMPYDEARAALLAVGVRF